MPEGSPDHGREYEICLAVIVHSVRYREHCIRKPERRLTLYVMKMSMRKKDRKTCAPYSAARVTRAVKGSGVLHDTNPEIISTLAHPYSPYTGVAACKHPRRRPQTPESTHPL